MVFVASVDVGGSRGPLASLSRPIFGGTGCDLHQKMRIILENIISSEKGSWGIQNGGKSKNLMTVGFEPTRETHQHETVLNVLKLAP